MKVNYKVKKTKNKQEMLPFNPEELFSTGSRNGDF